MENNSTEDFWAEKYSSGKTGWDMGQASPPLTAFLQRLNHKDHKILIPGAGNAYEAEWLWKNGFKNTYVVDIAVAPLKNLKRRVPEFPSSQLLHLDFFQLEGQFDLIIEQTFFCALPPSLRGAYIKKMKQLLHPHGTLFGVLFDFPLTENGPPFGGSQQEYEKLFSQYLKIQKMERCYNSIEPRQGSELFFKLVKQ